jgi:hypothetical protein
LEHLREMIHSQAFKEGYREHEQDFTRNRILTFVGLVVSQLNLMSKSLSVEVSRFVERLLGGEKDYSKQAYSQCRRKLKAEAFTALNQELVQQYYADGDYGNWRNYLLLAVDGTLLQLPESAELTASFGLAENKGKSMPMGRSSLLYDVKNELVLHAQLKRYVSSEQAMALAHLDYLQELCLPARCLLLFDRGYPSLWLLACLQSRKLGFVMRCNANFLTEVSAFAQAAARDAVLELDLQVGNRLRKEKLQPFLQPGQTKLWVRAVKVELGSAETAYLLTSLEQLPLADFQQLYHQRWGIETGLDFYKNVLQLENFSAKTALGIQQDFQAHLLAANLSALLVADANQELEREQAHKQHKHRYKVNRAVALGLVKDHLAGLLLGKQAAEEVYERLKQKIKRRKVAIRPNRTFPRKRKLNYKYHVNKRAVL